MAHSTPKIVSLVKRRGIRDVKETEINNVSSDDEFSDHESNNYSGDSHHVDTSYNLKRKPIDYFTFNKKLYVFFVIAVVVIITLLQCHKMNTWKHQIGITDLKNKYGAQEEDFWISFQVLLKDSIKYNQPKSLMLLYNDDTLSTIESLLIDLSHYAVCKLTNCSSIPIILEPNEFEESHIDYDYGNIIEWNKQKLEESGVMIVKNLERIPGKSALAFHSFCDEYQPVVPKAVFVFTLKVDQHSKVKTEYVEYILRKKWSNLSDDLFYPLLARITNFIFIVQETVW